jgi:hypothetical protein
MSTGRKGIQCVALAIFVSTVASTARAAEQRTAELRHLVQAAEHLEKAGRHELASQVYTMIAAEARARQQRLADRSQGPGGQGGGQMLLPGGPSCPAAHCVSKDQVTIEVKLIEFSWDKLQQAGMNLVSLRNLFESSGTSTVVDEDGEISEFLELLCQEGLARVLTKPKLITLSGQPAAFEIGHDPATLPPNAHSRTRLECTPRVTDQGKLSLDLDFGLQIAAHGLAGQRAGGETDRDDGFLGVKTQVEVESGNTLILGGFSQTTASAAKSDSKSMLLLLTARAERISSQSHSP